MAFFYRWRSLKCIPETEHLEKILQDAPLSKPEGSQHVLLMDLHLRPYPQHRPLLSPPHSVPTLSHVAQHFDASYACYWNYIKVGFPGSKEPACQCRRLKRPRFWSMGWGRSPGGEHGNLLQQSCLENPMDRGALQTRVHRVAKSLKQLKRLSTNTQLWKEIGFLLLQNSEHNQRLHKRWVA